MNRLGRIPYNKQRVVNLPNVYIALIWSRSPHTTMEADSEFAEILLKKGFDFTVLNNEGYAPVHIVCQRFKYSERAFPYLKLLADYRIDLNQRSGDSAKRSAFDIAKLNRDYKLIEYLEKLMNRR